MVSPLSLPACPVVNGIDTDSFGVILGTDESKPVWVAIKGSVFDVSGNAAYAVGGQYHGTSEPFLPFYCHPSPLPLPPYYFTPRILPALVS